MEYYKSIIIQWSHDFRVHTTPYHLHFFPLPLICTIMHNFPAKTVARWWCAPRHKSFKTNGLSQCAIRTFLNGLAKFSGCTLYKSYLKCRIWICGIFAFSTNFCPIKTVLSGNTVWLQASKMLIETFSVIFKYRAGSFWFYRNTVF